MPSPSHEANYKTLLLNDKFLSFEYFVSLMSSLNTCFFKKSIELVDNIGVPWREIRIARKKKCALR